MAEFDSVFRTSVEQVNKRLKSREPDVVKAFNQYSGRSLVMRVVGDATYSFTVGHDGLCYQLNPRSAPDDMYLELGLDRARKLIYHRTLGLLDLPFIRYRNITMADVESSAENNLFGSGGGYGGSARPRTLDTILA